MKTVGQESASASSVFLLAPEVEGQPPVLRQMINTHPHDRGG